MASSIPSLIIMLIGICFFAILLSVPLFCVGLLIFTLIKTVIKNVRNKQKRETLYVLSVFLCIFIMLASWIFNMGWMRVIMTWALTPVIHTLAFTIINIIAISKLRESKKLEIFTRLSLITYAAAYITLPDGGDIGPSYAFFGLLRFDWVMYVGTYLAFFFFAANVVFMILQIVQSARVKKLQKLQPSKKFDGILICTDLDGTLLNSERVISRENLDAIEHFKSEGGRFTFVTGRMPYFVADIYNTVKPNAPFGCVNGGAIYDHRTMSYSWTQEMPRSVFELVEYADKNFDDLGIQVNTFDKIYFCRENETMELFRKITGMPKLNCHYNEVNEPIAKIVFGSQKEEDITRLAELLSAHPRAEEFDFIRSELTLYEILPKGISKGSVLPRMAELLGISPDKIVAVGDYNNDISMLRSAKLGIAVANAVPEVKAAADHVTVSNDEHAIAKIISDLESGALKLD